jgi:hypothetical protein
MKNEYDKTPDVNAAVTAAILTEAYGLLSARMNEIRRDAVESFKQSDDAEKPIAKVSISATWPPEENAPEIEVSLSWSVRHKFSSIVKTDPSQTEISFP